MCYERASGYNRFNRSSSTIVAITPVCLEIVVRFDKMSSCIHGSTCKRSALANVQCTVVREGETLACFCQGWKALQDFGHLFTLLTILSTRLFSFVNIMYLPLFCANDCLCYFICSVTVYMKSTFHFAMTDRLLSSNVITPNSTF